MLVSFIIPAYNSAYTITRCLDSIYALPFKKEEFEVIVIDDCSTDNTREIVESLKLKSPNNFIFLRQPQNNRQGAARNRGVNIAKGEYVCFVDSDDAVIDGLVTAVRMASEMQPDMTAIHFAKVNASSKIISKPEYLCFNPRTYFSGIKMLELYPWWCSAPWGYLYRKEFLNKVGYAFAEGVLYEDADYVMHHLYHAQTMIYIPELCYLAYDQHYSVTHRTSFENYADWLLLGVRMLELTAHIEEEKTSNSNIHKSALKGVIDKILAGACYNITMPFNKLYKLFKWDNMLAFYNRVDSRTNRFLLVKDERIHVENYWTPWTSFAFRHKYVACFVSVIISYVYKCYKYING